MSDVLGNNLACPDFLLPQNIGALALCRKNSIRKLKSEDFVCERALEFVAGKNAGSSWVIFLVVELENLSF